MKKLAFLLASAGLLLTACIAEDSQMTEPIQEAVIISASYDAPDSEPGTKSTLDENGAFEWTEGDAFIARNANGYWYDFTKTDTEYADKYKANFIGFGVPGGSVTFPAVFPARAFSDASGEGATLKPDFTPDDDILRVYFPNTIAWTEGQVNNYMVSNFYRDNANNIQFLNMAGMLKFEFSNVPVNATKFAVSIYGAKIANTAADKSDVSTWFSVDSLNLNYDDDNHPTTFAKKIGEDEFSTVTFTFDKVVTAGKSMTFYLPVPQMDLNDEASLSVPYNRVKIQFLDAEDNVLESFTSSKKNRYIRRKQIKTFPSITFMTGGAETKVVEEVNPTDPEYNQTFTLPKTSNDVIVKVYKTTGTITLKYASDATSDEKPSNVTVRMVSDGDQTEDEIEALNIQLPASHVTIETDSENDKIKVKDVTAVTSPSTLVVKSGVKVESLTVAQGNAEVAGNVSAVTVEANSTQGSNRILVSVAKTAAVKTITLETVATVTVEQPEGNIAESDTQNKVNVIVKSGASGSTATAQNGGDIYVTANSAVEVVADGTGSTITVDPKSETPGEIEPTEEGGEIIFGKAAKIGEVEYATLPDAFAAVADGQTIVLLANVALTDRLFVNAGSEPAYDSKSRYATTTEDKEVTLDLNGFSISSSSNIALAGGTLNIVNKGATASAITSSNSGLAPVEVRGTGYLDAKRTLTIGQKVTLDGLEYGLNIFGSNNAEANKIDVNVASGAVVNGSIFVLGNLTNANNAINISVNGTVAAPENENGIAINGNANVVVNTGATVSGDTGIEVRAGKLTVNGGTITANASEFSYTPNNSGTSTKGAAVAVSQHSTKLATYATLLGGTLNGAEKVVVYDAQENNLSGVTVNASADIKEEATVPEGFAWVYSDSSYTLQRCVAKIGTDGFATLEAAVEAAAAAGTETTIVMIADYAAPAAVIIPEDAVVVLDLNGKTISYGGEATVSGGLIQVKRGASLTVNDASRASNYKVGTGKIDGSTSKTYAALQVTVLNDNDSKTATLKVNNTNIVGYYYGITGNGSRHNTVIELKYANVEGTCTGGNLGVYHPQHGQLTVSNSTITGFSSGIEMRAGTLTVNSGTINATATELKSVPNGSGTTIEGAAIAVSQHSTNLNLSINLKGGTYNGLYSLYEKDNQDAVAHDKIAIAVTGGSYYGQIFSQNVTGFITSGSFYGAETPAVSYLPENYGWSTYGSGDDAVSRSYKTVVNTAAEINSLFKVAGTKTATLASDVYGNTNIVNGTFDSNSDLTLDLNGHSISVTRNIGYAISLRASNNTLTLKNGTVVGANENNYGIWNQSETNTFVLDNVNVYGYCHAVYAQKGTIEIKGGSYRLLDENPERDVNGNVKFLLNCLDASYTAGTASIVVKGG